MKNLLLTWASGDVFCRSADFKVYLESTREHISSDKVIVTHDMSQEIEESLAKYDFQVYRVNPSEVGYPITDRHLHFWRFLNLHQNEYQYVLHTDCRDVVFQSDPFKFKMAHPFITLTDEGMPPSSSGFHLIEQFRFQKDIPDIFKKDCRQRGIINGGVVFGTLQEVKNHLFLLWSMSIKMTSDVTDQAALNYLVHYLQEDPVYHISTPTQENFCLTGEGTKNGFVPFSFKQDKFYQLKTDDVYAIVHQWDRTEFKNQILDIYNPS